MSSFTAQYINNWVPRKVGLECRNYFPEIEIINITEFIFIQNNIQLQFGDIIWFIISILNHSTVHRILSVSFSEHDSLIVKVLSHAFKLNLNLWLFCYNYMYKQNNLFSRFSKLCLLQYPYEMYIITTPNFLSIVYYFYNINLTYSIACT